MRSLGVPKERPIAPSLATRSIKKNRQFLAKSAGTRYLFSESRLARLTFSMADPGFGARLEMAPQPVEIAQNGLGNGEPPARDCERSGL
jgi:hypothetical protein